MTFIASVIAKEGVAMVADSFMTTSEHSLDEPTFIDYIDNAADKTNIPINDLIPLFKRRPSHTRNYVDKLFKFDDDSGVSTTGAAYINGKEIKDIIASIKATMQIDKDIYYAKPITDRLTEICSKLKDEVLEHLKKLDVRETDFIFSHFNRIKNEPQIFIIKIKEIDKNSFDATDPTLVTFIERTSLMVVTDGQDTFVDRLIFGSLYRNIYKVKETFVKYIDDKMHPTPELLEEIKTEVLHLDFMKAEIQEDIFAIDFRELSLQEAVDFACLLIKIVMDIQVYTEKIPTVGGLIRLAVISKEKGFDWISGDKIIAPKII